MCPSLLQPGADSSSSFTPLERFGWKTPLKSGLHPKFGSSPKIPAGFPAPGTSQVLLEFCHPTLLLIPAPLSPVVVNSLEFPSFWVHCRILKGIRTDPHHPSPLFHPSIPNPVKNPGIGGKNLPGAAGRAGSAQFQRLGVTWGSGKGGTGWGLSFFQPKTSCGVGDPQGLSCSLSRANSKPGSFIPNSFLLS